MAEAIRCNCCKKILNPLLFLSVRDKLAIITLFEEASDIEEGDIYMTCIECSRRREVLLNAMEIFGCEKSH